MTWPRSSAYFLVLIQANVLQPVDQVTLVKRVQQAAKVESGKEPPSEPSVKAIISELQNNGLIIKNRGRFSVTAIGLDRLAQFGLSRARDKHRLFLLKKRLNRKYNAIE